MYINDVTTAVDNGVITRLYADDLKLYCKIDSITDEFKLQNNLNKLSKWSKDWQLEISNTKRCAIILGNHKAAHNRAPVYFIGNHKLQSCSEVNDLGVQIRSDMKVESHINKIVSKARIRSYFIKNVSDHVTQKL